MNNIEAFNRAFFVQINAVPGTATWIIDSVIIIANDLIYLIPVLLVGLWLRGGDGRRNVALQACAVAMLGVGLNQVIGLVWEHPRPFAIGLGHTWMQHAADSSFPSDHVTIFTGIGISLLLGREVLLGALTLAVGLCVAWSRVFLGVHFPLDMLGAVGMAVFSYAVIAMPWRLSGKQVTLFAEQLYRLVMARPIERGWLHR